MKKGKIMLIAIAIIATVGGALAFKAQKFGSFRMYTSTIVNGAQTCTSITPTFLTTVKPYPGAISFGSFYVTKDPVDPSLCTTYTTAYVDAL